MSKQWIDHSTISEIWKESKLIIEQNKNLSIRVEDLESEVRDLESQFIDNERVNINYKEAYNINLKELKKLKEEKQ